MSRKRLTSLVFGTSVQQTACSQAYRMVIVDVAGAIEIIVQSPADLDYYLGTTSSPCHSE
ncbi:MAG TPA: hypothetical protein VM260_23750 [Pirellula sp.]|nr:hypothetical protein [Pirellula sp.]